jgi:hypothetical protein
MNNNGNGLEPLKHLKPLSERNAETAAISIRLLEGKVHQAMETIQLQQRTMTMLLARMSDLENKVNISKMQMTGLGPSVQS